MPKPKKTNEPKKYQSLPDYIGFMISAADIRTERHRQQWAELVAESILGHTGNLPTTAPTKEATVNALERASLLLDVARIVALEGQRRAKKLGAPKTPTE
jgi:hypothetical protein